MVRNGERGQASIPINDIRGEFIDLRMLSYEFVILEVNGASCEFALDDIYWEGGETVDVIYKDKSISPNQFILYDNYPNPFNPSTHISFSAPYANHVSIDIYDIRGNNVIKLFNKYVSAGRHSIYWKGINRKGSKVSGGVYFYSIKSERFSQIKKMILLK